MKCAQCSYEIPDALNTCPNCGRPAEKISGAPTSQSPNAPTTQQPFIDTSRLTEKDRITGIASAVLLISLFLPWFGASALGVTISDDGLASHGYLGIVLVLCLAILGYLVLHASPVRATLEPRAHDRIMLAATAVNLLLVLIGFIATPNEYLTSHEYGSFVGGVAALAAVAPIGTTVFNVFTRRSRP
jgi:hypothetical protein